MNITAFAQYAGVSKAAVSRYFNGGYLSAEKRAQIAAAVEATGYRPSMQAQLLRTPRIVGPRRMLRAYPKLRHGKKLRTLPTLREMLHRAEQENKDDNKEPK